MHAPFSQLMLTFKFQGIIIIIIIIIIVIITIILAIIIIITRPMPAYGRQGLASGIVGPRYR